MTTRSFTIAGKPVAASRPRVPRYGKAYYEEPYNSWRVWAQAELSGRWPWGPIEGPVSFVMEIYFKRPKRLGIGGREPRPSVPDNDNLEKAWFDSAKRAGIYSDDGQIVFNSTMSWYCEHGTVPRVDITVGPWRKRA